LLKRFVVGMVSAGAIAVAVSLIPAGASANIIYQCPPGVHNHKYCTREVKCVVPKLTGDTLHQATNALRDHDCEVGTLTRVTSQHSKVKSGRVLYSQPGAGSIRKKHFKVGLYLKK